MELKRIFLLLATVVTIGADKQIPNFLDYVGSFKFNETEGGRFVVKNYYLSRQVRYNWDEAFLSCLTVGMRLATIENDLESRNLITIAKGNLNLLDKQIHIDVSDNVSNTPSDSANCMKFFKPTFGKGRFTPIDCFNSETEFLCEDVTITDKFDKPEKIDDVVVDVKAKFYSHLGDYKKESSWKSYYISKTATSLSRAHQACQSFDMILTSPQDQSEYDNLQKLVEDFDEWEMKAAISGYQNKKSSYNVSWYEREPRGSSDDDCFAFEKRGRNRVGIKNYPCSEPRPFICEFDHSKATDGRNKVNKALYFASLANYTISGVTKSLELSRIKKSFIGAKLLCLNFGMELLVPDSEEEDLEIEKLLHENRIDYTIFTGLTKSGNGDSYYSINSGKVLNFDLEFSEGRGGECLYLYLRSGETSQINYVPTYCSTGTNQYYVEVNHFICQKIVRGAESTTSTTDSLAADHKQI